AKRITGLLPDASRPPESASDMGWEPIDNMRRGLSVRRQHVVFLGGPGVQYEERPPPAALAPWVAVYWRIEADVGCGSRECSACCSPGAARAGRDRQSSTATTTSRTWSTTCVSRSGRRRTRY